MSQQVEKMIDKIVNVITNDGRNFVGTLSSFDQKTNLILSDCNERVYTGKEVVVDSLGMYFIRGDNVAVIGEIDIKAEEVLDYNKIKAAPIKPMLIH